MSVRVLYGSSVVDSNWNTVGNWYTDQFPSQGGSAVATAIPADGDQVYTDGSFTTGPYQPVHLSMFSNAYVSYDAMDYSHVFASNIDFWGGNWVTPVTDGYNSFNWCNVYCTFTGGVNSFNNGTCIGNPAVFSGGSNGVESGVSVNGLTISGGQNEFYDAGAYGGSNEGSVWTLTLSGVCIYGGFTIFQNIGGYYLGVLLYSGQISFDGYSAATFFSARGGLSSFLGSVSFDNGMTYFMSARLIPPVGLGI